MKIQFIEKLLFGVGALAISAGLYFPPQNPVRDNLIERASELEKTALVRSYKHRVSITLGQAMRNDSERKNLQSFVESPEVNEYTKNCDQITTLPIIFS